MNIETLSNAIAFYGSEEQTLKTIEELAELTQAILKLRFVGKDGRNTDLIKKAKDNVAEEIADVEIMLEQIKLIYGNTKLVKTYKKNKIERLAERIG